MRLKKYEHACFTVEDAGQVLVVDPGNLTNDFVVSDNIVAVVITHEHGDHFSPDLLAVIYDKNPNSILISLPEIIDKMPDHKSKAVKAGDKVDVGPFTLEFFGGKHALIHDSLAIIDNIGVLVNESVYYPGDSFALTNRPIDVLALPSSAPWLKISESIDFLVATKPMLAFPTHDAILSDAGKQIVDRVLSKAAENHTIAYNRIDGTEINI